MSCFSKRTTDLPASRRRTAAMSPAVPAPASATSTSTAWSVPAARLCGSQAEGRQVAAGVHDCIRDGVPDGDGSGRRARDGINVEVFRLEDSRRHHGGRRRADADGVVASQHANRGEVSVGHNYLGNQLVVVAHGRADPFSVSEVFGDPFLGSRVRHGSLIRWRLLWGGASGQPSDGGGPTESQGPHDKVPAIELHKRIPSFWDCWCRDKVLARRGPLEVWNAIAAAATPKIGAFLASDASASMTENWVSFRVRPVQIHAVFAFVKK